MKEEESKVGTCSRIGSSKLKYKAVEENTRHSSKKGEEESSGFIYWLKQVGTDNDNERKGKKQPGVAGAFDREEFWMPSWNSSIKILGIDFG
jgi:hypothetical protein